MSVMDTFSLKGKTAFVTGGAGLYGRQIVRSLAEAGALVYMASRNIEALEKVASEHKVEGHDVRALRMDQGDEKSILATRDMVLKESGKIDVLINNAVARTVKKVILMMLH